MSTTTNLNTLKIYKLSQAQYETRLNGEAEGIDENSLYMTLDDGALAIEDGGTGATTAEQALDNLGAVGRSTAGKVYTIDGTEVVAGDGAEIFNDYTNNIAAGKYSHAEGRYAEASGAYSSAFGYNTKAKGWAASAKGTSAMAIGNYSSAKGRGFSITLHLTGEANSTFYTISDSFQEDYSLLNYWSDIAQLAKYDFHYMIANYNGIWSGVKNYEYKLDSDGQIDYSNPIMNVTLYDTLSETSALNDVEVTFFTQVAIGGASSIEGISNITKGIYSHAEGYRNYVEGDASSAKGQQNKVLDHSSSAEGIHVLAAKSLSHIEGRGAHLELLLTGEAGSKTYTVNSSFSKNTIVPGYHSSIKHFLQNTLENTVANFNDIYATVQGIWLNYDDNSELVLSQPVKKITLSVTLSADSALNNTRVIFYAQAGAVYLSHLEGLYNTSNAEGCHIEGNCNQSLGKYSHIEGNENYSSGSYSHAEGTNGWAGGQSSHVEGGSYGKNYGRLLISGSGTTYNLYAMPGETGPTFKPDLFVGSMIEINGKKVSITSIDSTNYGSIIDDTGYHFQGKIEVSSAPSNEEITLIPIIFWRHQASGDYSHAEGFDTQAVGNYSHAEGHRTHATGEGSHAEGQLSEATGNISHAEGGAIATGEYSHGEGIESRAGGSASHAEGYQTVASGTDSHAEGQYTVAYGLNSHAEGYSERYKLYLTGAANATTYTYTGTTAFTPIIGAFLMNPEGTSFHLIENYTTTNSTGTKGTLTFGTTLSSTALDSVEYHYRRGGIATTEAAHSEGKNTIADGEASHAEGGLCAASGAYSHAAGYNTTAGQYQTVVGRNNYPRNGPSSLTDVSSEKRLFEVGIGTSGTLSSRKNGFSVDPAGKIYSISALSTGGADYAEYFEWLDGNPGNEDRRGRFVVLDGEKIHYATNKDDDILGITSANPTVLGDDQTEMWYHQYLRDIYGAKIEETIEVEETVDELGYTIPAHTETQWILNPDFDPEQEYISRELRPEWDPVGIVGKLVVEDDGTCQVNGYCYPGVDGIATASSEKTAYRVMSRLDDTHIKVFIK